MKKYYDPNAKGDLPVYRLFTQPPAYIPYTEVVVIPADTITKAREALQESARELWETYGDKGDTFKRVTAAIALLDGDVK